MVAPFGCCRFFFVNSKRFGYGIGGEGNAGSSKGRFRASPGGLGRGFRRRVDQPGARILGSKQAQRGKITCALVDIAA